MYNVLLFRFVKDGYLESFLDGELYMNPYSHFRKIEETINRGDRQEGVGASYRSESIEISIKNADGNLVPIGGLINRVNFRHQFDHQVNIFCMSMFVLDFSNSTTFDFKLDEKFGSFADSAVLITQPQNFIDQVTDNLQGKKTPPCSNKFFDKVDYLPSDYNGKIGCFSKLEEYEWQNEWRIATIDPSREKPEPMKLNIGDIRLITKVYKTQFLINEGLKVSLT